MRKSYACFYDQCHDSGENSAGLQHLGNATVSRRLKRLPLARSKRYRLPNSALNAFIWPVIHRLWTRSKKRKICAPRHSLQGH